jgi:hypothetical protein
VAKEVSCLRLFTQVSRAYKNGCKNNLFLKVEIDCFEVGHLLTFVQIDHARHLKEVLNETTHINETFRRLGYLQNVRPLKEPPSLFRMCQAQGACEAMKSCCILQSQDPIATLNKFSMIVSWLKDMKVRSIQVDLS